MYNTLFIMTHLGSGWEKLSKLLEKNSYIQVFQTGNSYKHPTDVSLLTSQIHRRNSSVSIWVDVIFHNKDFTMKHLCDYYKIIFWSCDFKDCEEELKNKYNYSQKQAEDYWSYRVQGLKQYKKRSPFSLWNPPLEEKSIFQSIFR